MTPVEPMHFRLWPMLAWAIVPGAAVWAAAMIVAWALQDTTLVLPAAAALAVAMLVEVCSIVILAVVVNRAFRRQSGNLAFVISQVVLAESMAKIVTLVLLGVLVWRLMTLPVRPFFLCLAGLYVAMLMGEKLWLSKALRRDFPPVH